MNTKYFYHYLRFAKDKGKPQKMMKKLNSCGNAKAFFSDLSANYLMELLLFDKKSDNKKTNNELIYKCNVEFLKFYLKRIGKTNLSGRILINRLDIQRLELINFNKVTLDEILEIFEKNISSFCEDEKAYISFEELTTDNVYDIFEYDDDITFSKILAYYNY